MLLFFFFFSWGLLCWVFDMLGLGVGVGLVEEGVEMWRCDGERGGGKGGGGGR